MTNEEYRDLLDLVTDLEMASNYDEAKWYYDRLCDHVAETVTDAQILSGLREVGSLLLMARECRENGHVRCALAFERKVDRILDKTVVLISTLEV